VGEIIDGLVSRLIKRMCTVPENAGTSDSGDTCYKSAICVVHIMLFCILISY
jgi:hypothetical protein